MFLIDSWRRSLSAVAFVKSLLKSFALATAASLAAFMSFKSHASALTCFFEFSFSFSSSLFTKSSSVLTSNTRLSAMANFCRVSSNSVSTDARTSDSALRRCSS